MSELTQKIEALLFVSSAPITEKELKEALSVSGRELRSALEELRFMLEFEGHGIFLKDLAGGWTLQTKPELSDLIRNFRTTAAAKKISLSKAAIEILTITAYNQPVTRSEIDEIRGVQSSGTLARLLELGLVKISGRSKTRALLYSTTKKFLEVFGLYSLENLPELDEVDSFRSFRKENDADLNVS